MPALLAAAGKLGILLPSFDVFETARKGAGPRRGYVAEAAQVHIAENSPEEVAFKLLYEIAEAEGMQMRLAGGPKKPDRQWILDTYAECIMAVRAPSSSR